MSYLEESRTSGAGLRAIADHLPSPIFYCDRDMVYRYVNPAGAALHGRAPDEIVGRHVSEVMVASQLELLKDRHAAVLSGETMRFEESREFRGNKNRRVQTEYVPDTDESGRVAGFFVMLTDVTERYNAELKARETSRQLQAIADTVPAQICFLDRDRRYIWVNRTTAKWFATDVDSIVGRSTEEVYGRDFVEKTQGYVDRVLSGETYDYEATYKFPDGVERTVDVSYIPNFRDDGTVDGYILLAHDVTDYRRTADELELLATTDSLTGVKNRRRFMELCDEEVVRAGRYGRPLSVVMCDIDHFKNINDKFGHDGGDAVLKRFASLASGMLREGVDTVGRLGGEEFALLLPETDAEAAAMVADRMREVCEKIAIRMDAGVAEITCSFGVTDLAGDDDDATSMLKRADMALYESKESGRNRVTVYREADGADDAPKRVETVKI